MKKKIFSIFLVLASVLNICAQNLVPNCSFELYSSCPPGPASLCNGWVEYNSADYLNSCDASNNFGVPINVYGYQYAHSGNGYIGLIAYYSTIFNREYVEVQLSSSLILGQTYYVQFYVSLQDTMQYAIENMGVLFTDTLFDPFPPPTYTWATGIPQFENSPGNMLNNKTNWTAVSGSFVASGGEQYITIGNFKDDASTVKQYLGGTTINTLGTNYYIDDVYVGITPPPVGIHENVEDTHNMKLYPNPNNGNMTLECNLLQNETGVLNIYDVTGKLMQTYKLTDNSKSVVVNAQSLPTGLYLYEINVNGRQMRKEKLTIIK